MRVTLIYAKSQGIPRKAGAEAEDHQTTAARPGRDEVYPPLGISILGAELLQLGHEVRLLDDSLRTLEELREGMRWAEVVGISALTPNARRARDLGRIAREELGRFVILGGPHPTTNPEYFLDAGAADICVQGEGDETLPEVLDNLDRPERWEQIQGITFKRKEDGVQHATPRRALVRDVDALPFPAYHLWDMGEYMRHMVNPGVPAITSRGCPYACTFCDAEMTPRQYRSMSVERTVDLVELILRTYDPPQVMFFDDLFTIQRKRVIALCKEIVQRGLSFEWHCESRVDTMDYEMLRWMLKAGCVKIAYGLESGSPRMLTTMKKGVKPEKIIAGARLNRELGMNFKFFILYGFPEERAEDHRITEDIIRQTRPDSMWVGLIQPIPGTEFYDQVQPELLVDVSEVEFNYWHAVEAFKHPVWSHEELHAEREKLFAAHRRATRGLVPRLQRKLERMRAMAKHPELIGDWWEVRSRRRRHWKRMAESRWASVYAEEGRPLHGAAATS